MVDGHVELRVRLPAGVVAQSGVLTEMQRLESHEMKVDIDLSTASVLSWLLKSIINDSVESFDLDASALEVRASGRLHMRVRVAAKHRGRVKP